MTTPTLPSSPPTYWDYLRLDSLLALQGGLEGDESALMPDELHFIVVHQVYELWFKLVLAELRLARRHLSERHVPEERIPYVVHHLRRVNEILKLAVDQFRIMETLTPQDFLDFRDKLMPASGFQSIQMREIEILLGLSERDRVSYGGIDALQHIERLAQSSPAGQEAWGRIEKARRERSLREALHDWLHRTPIQGSGPDDPGDDVVVETFLADYLSASERTGRIQAERVVEVFGGEGDGARGALERRFADALAMSRRFLLAEDVEGVEERLRTRRIRAGLLFIESYRHLPLLAWPRLLVDAIVETEEHLVLWRTRHARMVERTIGRRAGTGGSSGVDYLDETAKTRIFPELWTVRTLLLPRASVPELKNQAAYGFAR